MDSQDWGMNYEEGQNSGVDFNGAEGGNAQNVSQGEVASNEKNLSIIVHIGSLFLGFLLPLIVYLISDDKPFAKENSKNALNFQITVAIAGIASGILAIILIGILTGLAVIVLDIIFCIKAGISASKGEVYKYPLAINFLK